MGATTYALQTAYTRIDSGSWSTTRTYIDAGQSGSNTYESSLYFGTLDLTNAKAVTLHLYRNDDYYTNTRTIALQARTAYGTAGTSMGTTTFSTGQGWKTVGLTAYKSTLSSAPYIYLAHGSGSNSYIQFYKTGTYAPYLSVETQDGAMYYYTGTAWQPCTVHYYDGTAWKQCIPYYYDGTQWKECGV